jgi:hypothetical protein
MNKVRLLEEGPAPAPSRNAGCDGERSAPPPAGGIGLEPLAVAAGELEPGSSKKRGRRRRPLRPLAEVKESFAVGAEDLARLLGISVATLERWEASGELGPAGIKKGGRRLWPLAEVREWVNAGMPRREIWTARNCIKGRG